VEIRETTDHPKKVFGIRTTFIPDTAYDLILLPYRFIYCGFRRVAGLSISLQKEKRQGVIQ
jgi:hypothetical protein